MKVLLFLAITLTSITIAKGQVVKKGDILLGASMGYNANSSRTNISGSSSNTNLSPRIGLGIGKNSILGFRTNLGFSTSKSDDIDYKDNSFNYGVDLFWKKLLPIANQVGWYIDASGGIGFRKDKYIRPNQPDQESRSTTYLVNAAPGIYYQPIKKLLLSADFGGIDYVYTRSKTEYPNVPASKSRSSSFRLSLLTSFTFSVDFILGKNS